MEYYWVVKHHSNRNIWGARDSEIIKGIKREGQSIRVDTVGVEKCKNYKRNIRKIWRVKKKRRRNIGEEIRTMNKIREVERKDWNEEKIREEAK